MLWKIVLQECFRLGHSDERVQGRQDRIVLVCHLSIPILLSPFEPGNASYWMKYIKENPHRANVTTEGALSLCQCFSLPRTTSTRTSSLLPNLEHYYHLPLLFPLSRPICLYLHTPSGRHIVCDWFEVILENYLSAKE